MSVDVVCPAWCVLDHQQDDADAIGEGWAWHRGRPTSWTTISGVTFEARLSCTTGLNGVRGETDTAPQIEVQAEGGTDVPLSGDVHVDDVNHLVHVLQDLVGLERRTRRRA